MSFIPETKRHFKVRLCKHLGSSYFAGKKGKIISNNLTAIQAQILCWNYSPSFEEFSILTRESNEFKLKITESPLSVRYKPVLTNAHSSLPLQLFQYTSVVIIWCFNTSYDVFLSHCAYGIVVCSIFFNMFQVSYFIKNRI